MNNIFNILVVSDSQVWATEFKRISDVNEIINVVGVSRGLHDFKIRMNQEVHVVIVSDVLSDGTLADVLSVLATQDVIVLGIINNPASAALLDSYQVSWAFEKEKMPFEIVNFLQETLPLSAADTSSQKHYETTPQEFVESHPSRFSTNPPQWQWNQQPDYQQLSQQNLYQQPLNPNIQTGDYQQNQSQMVRNTYDDTNRLNNPQNQLNTGGYMPRANQAETTQSVPQRRGVTTMGVLKPKVVCFTSAKGGVGKSSVAIEVAASIAARANEVEFNMTTTRGAKNEINAVLADLNCAYGTIGATLPCVSDLKNPPSLANWILKIREKVYANLSSLDKQELQTQENPRYTAYINKINRNALKFTKSEVLELLVKDPKTGLYILPSLASNFDVQDVEDIFIEIVIEELSSFFEAVILDTGNNFEGFTRTAFRMSNEIYVVAQPNIQVCDIIQKMLLDSERLGVDREKFRLIINHPQTNKQSITDESMVRALNLQLSGTISHDENLILAHDAGRFYVINNKKKPVAKDITLIANQVCPLWNVAGVSKKGGMLQKLFGK